MPPTTATVQNNRTRILFGCSAYLFHRSTVASSQQCSGGTADSTRLEGAADLFSLLTSARHRVRELCERSVRKMDALKGLPYFSPGQARHERRPGYAAPKFHPPLLLRRRGTGRGGRSHIPSLNLQETSAAFLPCPSEGTTSREAILSCWGIHLVVGLGSHWERGPLLSGFTGRPGYAHPFSSNGFHLVLALWPQ